MDDPELPPDRLASVFAQFVKQVAGLAAAQTSPLLERLRSHLAAELAQLPVTVEQFDSFDLPNLQVALDAYLAADGRSAELLGVTMEHKRFMAVGLSELVSWSGEGFGSRRLVEGPVDYDNFHLADGRVLACVHFTFRNRPGPLVPAAPIGPARMHQKNFQLRPDTPVHQDAGARSRSTT